MSIPYNWNTAGDCLRIVEGFLLVAIVISTLQHLVNSKVYGPQGLLSWRFQKYAYRIKALERRGFDVLFGRGGMIVLHLLRLTGLALAVAGIQPPWALSGVFILHALIYFRSYMIMTGADQLTTMILLCLLAAAWEPRPEMQALSLCVIAIQVIICYVSNGMVKAFEPGWREGFALRDLLLTEEYGRGWITRLMKKEGLTKLLSYGVIAWEVAAIATPFLPAAGVWVYLGVGVLFHLAVALAMGLNTFFWTFLSTYPAILYLNSRVFPVVCNWPMV